MCGGSGSGAQNLELVRLKVMKMLQYGQFQFGEAVTDDFIRETFRLRYQIYVKEFGFERVEDHKDGLEKDDYEEHSRYFVCLNENKMVVGTVRLVFHSKKGFPIEHATETVFVGEKPDPVNIAEISRLAISKDLRRRKEDGQFGVESYLKKSDGGILSDDEAVSSKYHARQRPIIVLGLYQALYHTSKRSGITHWYMITEKKLAKALGKYGFKFHQIGEPVHYHGERVPFLGIIDEIERDLAKSDPEMLKLMLLGLDEKYHPECARDL